MLQQAGSFHLITFGHMMRLMRFVVLTLATGTLLQVAAVADDVVLHKVDQIFSVYDKPGSPGCSLGVIRDGNFVDRKAYGLGNLELGVQLSPQSVFYMGSVSKQFTAAAVVLAAEQGFLSLDDDVRKYVPELPDYGHVITLRQMLHQTSGFRDFFTLIALSGRNVSDFNSPDEILKLVLRQRGLNNIPGDEWIYSNTNYFLLAVVVKRATKKSLAEFASENIFQPLGMSHTLFYDDHTLVVPGRVAAYDSGTRGNFIVDWSTTYEMVGGGGLMSSVDDLLSWDRNFYANRLGKGTLTKELQTPGVLNNGNTISYAMGLDLGNYRGLPIVEHGGALFGYRTEFLRFPTQKFTVICLCNIASAVPENLARKVVDLYLADKLQPAASALEPSGTGHLPDPATFAGKYLDPRTHMMYSFTASNGDLMAWGGVLRRISSHKFYDLESNVITFERSDGVMNAKLNIQGETYFSGRRVEELRLSNTALAAYAGQFRSSELDATYSLSLEQGTLTLRNRDNAPEKLIPIATDEFDAKGLGRIVFHRDSQGQVSGLAVFTQDARDIELKRPIEHSAVKCQETERWLRNATVAPPAKLGLRARRSPSHYRFDWSVERNRFAPWPTSPAGRGYQSPGRWCRRPGTTRLDLTRFGETACSLQSQDAEKDLLDGLHPAWTAGGLPAPVLVGLWRDHSHSLHRLVGGVPQRLVLNLPRPSARPRGGPRNLVMDCKFHSLKVSPGNL